MSSNSLFKSLTVLGTFAFLLCFYADVFFSPNSYLFSNTNDGIKNYYTYAYHIKNNQSATNFEGFNYPYGENVLYTDCHPILVSILKPLATFLPYVETHSIGILNSLMLFAILLCAYLLFLLLRELKVSHFLATMGAIAITVLSPQIFRLQGHFALSYSFAIPLTLLFLLRYLNQNKAKKQLLLLTLFLATLLFVHAYLGIICISILVAYFLVDVVLNRFKKSSSWGLLLSSFISMVPFLLVKLITDFHQFRTNNPYGFFEYYADVDTILLPNQGPWQKFLFSFLPNFTQTWEGWAYIGLGTIILLPFIGFHFLQKFKSDSNFYFNKILLAATLLLLFSFGFPFRFGLENWLEYFSFLKQFRAIGRFAWVFYFVISVYAFALIDSWAQRSNSKIAKAALTCCLPLLMIAEGIPYHKNVSKSIGQVANGFDANQLNDDFQEFLTELNPNAFQAIIPLPFYNIGCENFEKEASGETYTNSMLLSYHTGLPLASSYLSRVSLQESKNSIQMMGPNFYEKAIQKDLPSKLPFLVYWNKNTTLNQYEKELVKELQRLSESSDFFIGSLAYSAIFENTANQEVQAFQNDTALIQNGEYLVSDSSMFFYFHNQDFLLYEEVEFRNENYFSIDKQKKNKVDVKINTSLLKKNNNYNASIWLSCLSENEGQDDLNHLEFVLEEKDMNGDVLQTIRKEAMSTFIHFENWSMIELDFSPLSTESTLEFFLIGNSPQPKTTYAADFLLRDSELNVFKVLQERNGQPTVLFKNNHSIKRVD